MANDNKIFAEIVKRVRRECNSYPLPNAAGEKLKLVREMEDAHSREIDGLAAQKTAESLEAVVKNAELAEAIAAKDAEIEDLKKENASLRVIVSGATVADGNLREEIEKLRTLVGELADALDGFRDAPCDSCMLNRCPGIEKCKETNGTVLLVAKAMEVVK